MEAALRTCCKGIKIGKILVVRHHGQGFSRAGTSIPSPAPLSALTTPKQALAAAEAAAASDGPFNSPRRNQQWQQFNAATAAYSGSSQTGSRASSRPLSASSSAAAAAAQDGSNVKGSSSIPGPAGPGVSPQGSPLPPVGYSTEGSAFAAALAASGGVNNQCWIQNSTQDVIYEKLPADIAERHVLLMDPVLSTGNSAYTAIEVCREWCVSSYSAAACKGSSTTHRQLPHLPTVSLCSSVTIICYRLHPVAMVPNSFAKSCPAGAAANSCCWRGVAWGPPTW
jgi:hypothetical protein